MLCLPSFDVVIALDELLAELTTPGCLSVSSADADTRKAQEMVSEMMCLDAGFMLLLI